MFQLYKLNTKTLKMVASLKKSIKYPTLNRLAACVGKKKTEEVPDVGSSVIFVIKHGFAIEASTRTCT